MTRPVSVGVLPFFAVWPGKMEQDRRGFVFDLLRQFEVRMHVPHPGRKTVFATAAIVLEVVFWIVMLSVAVGFVAALISGTIEDIRDHKRIVAARTARGILPPSTRWERAIRMRQLRSH